MNSEFEESIIDLPKKKGEIILRKGNKSVKYIFVFSVTF